jgi:hypothetical protein
MKIKQTLIIQARQYHHENNFEIIIDTLLHESNGVTSYVKICEHEIELDVPEFTQNDFNKGQVKQLQEMRIKVMADNQIRLQSIDDKIASLLALESK